MQFGNLSNGSMSLSAASWWTRAFTHSLQDFRVPPEVDTRLQRAANNSLGTRDGQWSVIRLGVGGCDGLESLVRDALGGGAKRGIRIVEAISESSSP